MTDDLTIERRDARRSSHWTDLDSLNSLSPAMIEGLPAAVAAAAADRSCRAIVITASGSGRSVPGST
ncbi:MAG: hypothetical protein R2710_09355 [Acidimicrobiales bacterium]